MSIFPKHSLAYKMTFWENFIYIFNLLLLVSSLCIFIYLYFYTEFKTWGTVYALCISVIAAINGVRLLLKYLNKYGKKEI